MKSFGSLPLLLTGALLLHVSSSQTCLSSPPELQWAYDNTTGIYEAITVFGASTKTINGVTFTTRLFDDMLPSQTWRMEPGETYQITVVNDLGDEAQGVVNQIRDLNWTNVHTHGLHISGESPADNVFSVVPPGEQLDYIYEIPCEHTGGTLWVS